MSPTDGSPPAVVAAVGLLAVAIAASGTTAGAAPGPRVVAVAVADVGDLDGLTINAGVVAIAAPNADGYWLAAADGGIFAFGDATFHGSMGGTPLNAPIVAIAPTSTGNGYWLAAADGGIFSFGDATFHGSLGDVGSSSPAIAIAADPAGKGYALLDESGAIWEFPSRTLSSQGDIDQPAVSLSWTATAIDVIHDDGTVVRRRGTGVPPSPPDVEGRVVAAAITDDGAGLRLAVVPDRITIAAGGDVHGESRVATLLARGDNPLEPVAARMADADLAIVNLETAVGTTGRRHPKRFTFQSSPLLVHRLADAGVDVVSLANNHALDFGVDALFETIDHATAAGLVVVGAGLNAAEAYAPRVVATDGGDVAIVGLTQVLSPGWAATADRPGLASGWDRAASVAAVEQAADLADTVVVTVHWGIERARCASVEQRSLAAALRAAGADVILGHHPHVLQGIERADGTLTAYSLGNFVWYHSRLPSGETALLEVEVEGGSVVDHRVQPAVIDGAGRPALVTGARADSIAGYTTAYRPGAGICPG